MNKPKVLITGGNGYIASAIKEYLSSFVDFTSITRQDLDLTDHCSVVKWFEDRNFDSVIHTASEGGNRLKPEDGDTLYRNLLMYDNLYDCRFHYNKFITFGSGAEFTSPRSPYGFGKRIIRESIRQNENFFYLRLFAVFDENEDDRRFIKTNIRKYINHEPMIVNSNKRMDFFYMQDLIDILHRYIFNDNYPWTIDCVYDRKYTLLDIANIINNLDDYRVEIIFNNHNEEDYTGNSGIRDRLVESITEVYNIMKRLKNVRD